MTRIIRKIKEMIAVLALAGLLFAPVFTTSAIAAVACIDTVDCPGGETCTCGGSCTEGGSCAGVPEMSDYLAVAFLVVAGTMIYFIRRREMVV